MHLNIAAVRDTIITSSMLNLLTLSYIFSYIQTCSDKYPMNVKNMRLEFRYEGANEEFTLINLLSVISVFVLQTGYRYDIPAHTEYHRWFISLHKLWFPIAPQATLRASRKRLHPVLLYTAVSEPEFRGSAYLGIALCK